MPGSWAASRKSSSTVTPRSSTWQMSLPISTASASLGYGTTILGRVWTWAPSRTLGSICSICSCVSGPPVLDGPPASALSPHAAKPPMAATAVTVRTIFLIILRIGCFPPVERDSTYCLSPDNRKPLELDSRGNQSPDYCCSLLRLTPTPDRTPADQYR